MIRLTILLHFVFIVSSAHSQDTCIKQQGDLLRRFAFHQITNNSTAFPIHRSEFRIIDIQLNKKGMIEKIELYKKDSSIFESQFVSLINKIRKGWIPVRCIGYQRILFPVYVYFESTMESGEQPFEIQSNKRAGLYVVPTARVLIYSPKRKGQ
jgi:hypothetical protein